ncbi:MAG: hypothetical protein QME70_07950 [Bacillota bacterium]|nr:hypothetical protein [Bacillota bacterium]
MLTFRDVASGQGVKPGLPLRPAGGLLLEHVVLRPIGDDLEARIKVKQQVTWNAEIQLLDGDGYDSTVRCRLSFRPAH